MTDEKSTLKTYLQSQRESLLWKLDGLSERQLRWPMVPTGTNLLGLVKHAATVEMGYFGRVFGRSELFDTPWIGPSAEANEDMWATADQTRDWVVEFYRNVWEFSDVTIDELEIQAQGAVPWWPEHRRNVTLHGILVHVISETARHAGHADIVRELIDGRAGLRPDSSNLPDCDQDWWDAYVVKLKETASQFQ